MKILHICFGVNNGRCRKKSDKVARYGKNKTGKQRMMCQNPEKYLDELLKLLSEFHIGMVYADNNFAYSSRISQDKLVTGKRNTQQIERNHLTLRTRIKRLARKTICFSKKRRNSQSCDRNFYKYILFRVCF